MLRRALLGVFLLLAVGLGLLTVMAVRDLRQARDQVSGVGGAVTRALTTASLRTPEARKRAIATVDAAANDVASARTTLVQSRSISLAGKVPGLRRQRTGTIVLLNDAERGLRAAHQLLEAADDGTTRVSGGRVDVAAMSSLGRRSDAAATVFRQLPRGAEGLWGPLAEARRDLDRTARDTALRLHDLGIGLRAGHTFLGGEGPRRYLIAIQNNAEMRDQGMVLSYAEASFDDGQLAVVRHGPIHEVRLKEDLPIPMDPGKEQIFGHLRPTFYWQNANATADFPWSASTMKAMYAASTGTEVDGVIGLDVPALTRLLRVTGPVRIEAVDTAISADNLARIVLSDLYQAVPIDQQDERRELLGDIVDGILGALTARDLDALALVEALGQAAAGGHVRLWSAHAAEEKAFEELELGGGPAVTAADRTIHLSVQNATASKLDYFVEPAARMGVLVNADGSAAIQLDVVVRNRAPKSAAASYQLGPVRAQTEAGEYITRIYFWGPEGAVQDQSVAESGLRLNQDPLLVPAGEERTTTFRTMIPNAVRNGQLMLRLVPQPRLKPIDLSITISAPGWDIGGPGFFASPWDRTIVRSWRLDRVGE